MSAKNVLCIMETGLERKNKIKMSVLEKILEEIEKEQNSYEADHAWNYSKGLEYAKEIIRSHMDEVQKDGWIPVEERLPENDDYIMLSFENSTVPEIGRYEEDEDGGGSFYLGDDDEGNTCASAGLFVNAWRPLPNPYKGE